MHRSGQDYGDKSMVYPASPGGISPAKSASVELSRVLGSVWCIQTLLAVQKSGSRTSPLISPNPIAGA
jgi:hypothetical protein